MWWLYRLDMVMGMIDVMTGIIKTMTAMTPADPTIRVDTVTRVDINQLTLFYLARNGG